MGSWIGRESSIGAEDYCQQQGGAHSERLQYL
jgi:hypothetical protein